MPNAAGSCWVFLAGQACGRSWERRRQQAPSGQGCRWSFVPGGAASVQAGPRSCSLSLLFINNAFLGLFKALNPSLLDVIPCECYLLF